MKKIISYISTLSLLLSLISFSLVSADDTSKISISSVTAKAGEYAEVILSVSSSASIVGIETEIEYDSNVVELVSVISSEDGIFPSDTFEGSESLTANPYYLSWDNSLSDAVAANGNLAVLKFKIKSDAYNGEYAVTPIFSSGGAFDEDLNDVDFNVESGCITVTDGIIPDNPITTSTTTTKATTTTSNSTSTTTTTTTTTRSGQVVSGEKVIDWNKQSNYYCSGTSSKQEGSITVSNSSTSSATRIINSWGNNVSAYDGIKFTVTADSGSSSDIQIELGGYETGFKAVSGSTEFVIDFKECGIDPSAVSDINFYANGAYNFTISDIVGYKNSVTPTSSSTSTTTTTTTTTTVPGPDLTVDLSMLTGASIRLNEQTGIRFYTTVDKDKINALRSEGYTVEMGTLIAPLDYLTNDTLTFDLAQGRYIDVKYTSEKYFTDSSGFSGIVGSIVNIKENTFSNQTSGNIVRKFAGRGYVKVIDKNGIETISYAPYEADNARSLGYVAYYLKNDSSAEAQKLYSNNRELVDKWSEHYQKLKDPMHEDIF